MNFIFNFTVVFVTGRTCEFFSILRPLVIMKENFQNIPEGRGPTTLYWAPPHLHHEMPSSLRILCVY